MRKQRFETSRARQGFTMTEILAVVGIMVIVFALAVPNLVNVSSSMRAAELNSKAEQVYNAVQFRLSSMKTNGMLASEGGKPDIVAFATLQKVIPEDYAAAPSEAPDEGTTRHAGAEHIVFAPKGSDAVDDYLLTDASAAITRVVTGGDFVIEFNPLTGEAYSVFYWEDDAQQADGADPRSGEAYYMAVRDNRSNAQYLSEHKVGYYKGGATSDLVESEASGGSGVAGDFDIDQTAMDIVNGEELYVRISNPTLRAESFDPSKLSISISVTSVVNYSSKTIEVSGAELSYVPGESEIDYILDSYYTDQNGTRMSFVELMSGTDITRSGAVADITVTVEYDGESWGSETKRVNTAFGESYMRVVDLVDGDCAYKYNEDRTAIVNGDGEVQEGFSVDADGYVLDASGNRILLSGKIYVDALRHLLNLDTANFEWGTSSYTTIVIDEDIDFDGTTWSAESVAAGAHRLRENKNPFYDESSGEYAPVAPISLNDGFNLGGANVIDGRGNSIKNIHIASTDEDGYSGLFDYLKASVENVTLENPSIEGGSRGTGAIVGYLESAGNYLDNCAVVGGAVSGSANVGGLVGVSSSARISNCTASADVLGTEADGSTVGGIIGFDNGARIESTNVVTRVNSDGDSEHCTISGTSEIGGFAGTVFNSQVVDCQAQANVTGSNDVGGFAGLLRSGGLTGCSVVGGSPSFNGIDPATVSSLGDSVGGFVGEAQGAEMTRCFAAIDVVGSPYDESCFNYGGFAGKLAGSPSFTGCYSSGDVAGYANVGGFAGLDRQTNTVSGCYTTSNVVANESAGGFVGRIESDGWTWNTDVSYGLLSRIDASPNGSFGGFYGTRSDGLDLTGRMQSCKYLEADRYNDSSEMNTESYQAAAATYDSLLANILTVAQSHPYSSALEGRAFPFAPTGAGGVTLEHYGDWPLRG